MNRTVKINLLVTPISLIILAIATIPTAILNGPWVYLLIGGLTGLLNHGIFVKQTARIIRMAKLDPEGKAYNARSNASLGHIIRSVVFIAVFVSLAFKADFKADRNAAIIAVLVAFAGYMVVKLVFLSLLLIYRKEVDNK